MTGPRPVVWLAGMPRSGTNWVSQILASSPALRMKFCPLFSYEFKNRLDETASPQDWAQLFSEVFVTRSEYLDQDYLRDKGLVPSFATGAAAPTVLGIKSTRFHNLTPGLLDKAPYVKLAVLVRHPVAAIHSWITNPLEFPDAADASMEWRSGACRKTGPGEFWGFDDWVATTRRYMALAQRAPERVQVFRYESFVAHPLKTARALLAFAGVPFSEQTAQFMVASTTGSDTHKRSVFKSSATAERWRREADPVLRQTIEAELVDTPLARFLEPVPLPGTEKHA